MWTNLLYIAIGWVSIMTACSIMLIFDEVRAIRKLLEEKKG